MGASGFVEGAFMLALVTVQHFMMGSTPFLKSATGKCSMVCTATPAVLAKLTAPPLCTTSMWGGLGFECFDAQTEHTGTLEETYTASFAQLGAKVVHKRVLTVP